MEILLWWTKHLIGGQNNTKILKKSQYSEHTNKLILPVVYLFQSSIINLEPVFLTTTFCLSRQRSSRINAIGSVIVTLPLDFFSNFRTFWFSIFLRPIFYFK